MASVVAGRHVRRDHAVGGVDDVHDVPLAAFGGVDRAQDQVVLVQQRRAGQVAGGRRRIERQLAQEAAAAV